MNLHTSLLIALLLTPALSASQPPQPPQYPQQSMLIQTESGPVIVRWGQPATLFKANEYQVRIDDFDRNGDGRLTRREIPSDHALRYEFVVADRNNDGFVTSEELLNW